MTFGVTHWNLGVPKPNTNKENWFVTGKTNNKVQKYRIFWYFPKEDTCSKISSNSNERLFFSAAELSAILFWNKMNKGELFSEVKVKIAVAVIRVNKWWTTYGPSLKKKKENLASPREGRDQMTVAEETMVSLARVAWRKRLGNLCQSNITKKLRRWKERIIEVFFFPQLTKNLKAPLCRSAEF